MTIPKSYEALAADLASEKIISKTLLGQKEAYMMLADKGRLDLATWKQKACEAAEREAALRESLTDKREEYNKLGDRYDDLQQRLTVAERRESEAREELLDLSRKLDAFYSRSHGIKNLSAIEDANDKSKSLQQRLTVAEQRSGLLEGLLEGSLESVRFDLERVESRKAETYLVALIASIESALKPAKEGEGS